MDSKNSPQAIAWQLFLITAGAVIFAFGAKSVLVHHNFIMGGFYGTCLLIYYKTAFLSPGILFLCASIPVMILAYLQFSLRFFLYTLWAVLVITLASEMITFDLQVKDQLYAAVAGGLICGIGSGIILRSMGSGGGLDVIALIINRKFNLGIGKVIIIHNIILFSLALVFYKEVDLVIASLILTVISSGVLEYVLALFNQRKIVYILSNSSKIIAKIIRDELKQGATIIEAKGAYSGKTKQMLMTITNNLQLKRLENKVFAIDPHALFIVENSFNVIGSNFSKRKLY